MIILEANILELRESIGEKTVTATTEQALALSNMDSMLVTADTSHVDKSWLKAQAYENMNAMLVTVDTSHFDRSWLKAEAI